MTHRAAALGLAVLLLLPAAAALAPAAPRPRAALLLTVTPDGAHAAWGPAPLAGETSECYALSPQQFRCEGADINVTNVIHFVLAFDAEAASTDDIHISQVVGTRVPFAYNCRAPEVLWATLLVLDDAACTTFGQAVFNNVSHVRLDIPYLPQEGIVSLGGWDVSMVSP
ncbi:MAG: hypothetical protein LC624_09400 [Halobacteriales archaeon]|nr:hypothetical protein [Halobacteriales archaeon]